MAIVWTNFDNGDSLASIREGINNFNNSVVVDVNAHTISIGNNQTNISTNTSDISTLQSSVSNNSSAISTNVSNISANQVAISSLSTRTTDNETDIVALTTRTTDNETDILSLQTMVNNKVFEYTKAPPVVDLAEDTPQLIGTLTVANLDAGTYFYSYSFEVDFKGVKDKTVHFRADIDGATGTVFDVQSDKKSNHKNRLYGYPKVRSSVATYTMEFYMWKEAGFTQPVDVNFCDLIIESK